MMYITMDVANVALKHEVVKLRRDGKTFSEIRDVLGPIPKSSLSTWLKNIELSGPQKARIRQKIQDKGALGRQKGGWRNHQKRVERIKRIQSVAEREFFPLFKNNLFLIGLALYLAEGARKVERFQFTNSDPRLVKITIKWLERVGGIPKRHIRARLYIHKVYESERCEEFWAKFLKISPVQFYHTIYKPTPHLVKKNPGYKGCIRIEIPGSELYWKIMKWGDLLYQNLV